MSGFDIIDPFIHDGLEEFVRSINLHEQRAGAKSFARFARERLWVRSKGATGGQVPFVLWPIQKRYLAMKRLARAKGKKARFLVLKHRRGGITTTEQGLSYQFTRDHSDTAALTIAHTATDTGKIFRIALLFHERDIDALPLRGLGNAQRLEYPGNGSVFEIATAGGKGVGRGSTLQRVHCSEFTKWSLGPNQIDKQQDTLAGLTRAAEHGEVVIETTANGTDLFCHLYREAKAGQNDWTPIFIRWFDDPNNVEAVTAEQAEELRATLTDRETELVAESGLAFEQIAWRRTARRELGPLFVQEYPEDDETCFLTSGTRFFDVSVMIHLLETVPEVTLEHLAGGTMVEWVEPRKRRRYVIGVDTSEGIEGGDRAGAGVLDLVTNEQVAAIHGVFRPKRLAEVVAALHRRYNGATVGIERENHGHAVLSHIEGLMARSRLYHFKPGRSGWSTNMETRPVMLDDLAEAIHSGAMKVHDRLLLQEMASFGLHGNKWQADPGEHDDAVFKWAIANQMRKFASQYRTGRVYFRDGGA